MYFSYCACSCNLVVPNLFCYKIIDIGNNIILITICFSELSRYFIRASKYSHDIVTVGL